ncbi:N-6 DNA methylase [Dietzia sp. CW19]|nr:N-6 DNA methylase [Dietzia sp. CW19]MBB1052702.1 N-6 DNA methylase [Dietzia sp. CW19]
MTGIAPFEVTATTFHATAVTRIVRELSAATKAKTKQRWLQAVASRVTILRPDLALDLLDLLGVEPLETDPLAGRTIGEIAVCYEALLAELDPVARRSAGQYFTPDDAAHLMAKRSAAFPTGIWMDPCCGVGNLAWHLAGVQDDPATFVRDRLVLVDLDDHALRSAVALIAADYLAEGDTEGLAALRGRAVRRDFLTRTALPEHQFVIVNPPYARDRVRAGFATGKTQELFAFFLERIAKDSQGFIAVTPASYLSSPKFQSLRTVLETNTTGGEVLVFDNVPDTLFRGYKFGSSNSSKTNFVRAAITACSPEMSRWKTTPIIRWRAASRQRMLAGCTNLLTPRLMGPHGEWVKTAPGLEAVWETLESAQQTLADLLVSEETEHRLTVAMTPRYYISAAFRDLNRGSKTVLHFASAEDRDRAALVLNSSISYLWWRALDGGVTLPKRVLRSIPIPDTVVADPKWIERLQQTEESSVVTKLNAGSLNENVKRPRDLVDGIDALLMPDIDRDFSLVYAEDMFPSH